MVSITLHPGKQLQVPVGTGLLEALRRAGVRLSAPCGGQGRCGKCLVKILGGLPDQSPWVLACKTTVVGDLTLELPQEELVVLQQGQLEPVPLEPAIFRDAAGCTKHRAGLPVAQGEEPHLGMAVDVGTTTLVAYLYDLSSGAALATTVAENGQASFGSDVMTRLAYALRGEDAYRALRQSLLDSLNGLLLDGCARAQVDPQRVKELVLVGNTPMVHMLLQLPLASLGAAPFQPAAQGPFYRTAGELGLLVTPQALCYLPPFIGGFVGSDALAAATSQGLGEGDDPILLVDIGTNGEILLQRGEHLLAASAPAGPALEGGQITCGMIARGGALQRVELGFDVQSEVIGGGRAVGLCGSALVDAMAELLRLGLMDRGGRLLKASEVPPIVSFKLKQRLQSNGENMRFQLTENVYLEQRDIREVQLAKAAIAAGIEVLLEEGSIRNHQLKSILLAGGFGNYLKPANALRMGLLGQFTPAQIKQVGNAAGAGACKLLLNYPSRVKAETLCKRFQHVELADDVRYQKAFLKHIDFPDKEN